MGKKRTATRFLKGFGAVLAQKASGDPDLLPFATAYEEALKGQIGKSPAAPPDSPLLAELEGLISAATADGADVQSLLRATNDAVAWYRCYPSNAKMPQELSEGMFAAHVVGSLGLLKSDRMLTGFFLIGPNVNYPLHDHVAAELYYVASGAIEIQNGFDASPRHLRAGEYSVTPSGMPHRLRTGDAPVLIVFAWAGAVACDVWWWEHEGGETWRRYVPERTIAPKPKVL